MTDTEKKVMVRLCTKILTETDLYEMDMEVRNLVDWICVSEQMKENNNKIRSLTGEYKQIEPECREGIREKIERIKKLCEERNGVDHQIICTYFCQIILTQFCHIPLVHAY